MISLVLPLAYMSVIAIMIMTLSTVELSILAFSWLLLRYFGLRKIAMSSSAFAIRLTTWIFLMARSKPMEVVYTHELPGRHIRLLRLLPDITGATIRCELIEASLEALPSYEAISYVWGAADSQGREVIVCDERNVHVTTSLAQSLHRLRYNHEPRLLWADGLCINQRNVIERGSQVQIMGDVFAKATRVVIWLGLDTENRDVKKAMEIITYIHSKVYHKIPKTGAGGRVVLDATDPTLTNLEDHMSEQSLTKPWDALASMFNRPWWRRIWCVQESILARETIVVCGEDSIEGHLIGTFSRWLYNQRWLGEYTPSEFDEKGAHSAYRRLNAWDWQGSFLEIINNFRGLEATDPRDKIYALLGLLQFNPELNVKIIADYRKTLPEVLFDTIKESIREEHNLHFLSQVDYRPELEERGDLPSWMPRWDQTREPWQDSLWCETSNLSAGRSDPIQDFPNAYVPKLHIRGVGFDTVIITTDDLVIRSMDPSTAIGAFIQGYLTDTVRPLQVLPFEYASALVILATTLTGGFLKTSGWADERAYLERLPTNLGHQYLADFFAFLDHHFPNERLDQQRVAELYDSSLQGRVRAYEELLKYSSGRRIFSTVHGHIGLGPTAMRVGDVVAVLDGGKVPYVLRPCREDGEYAFVGECFVRDIMSGQVYDMLGHNGVEERDFILQ